MPTSYDKLWKLLIDKKMVREDLRKALGFSPSTMAKMGKEENVSMEVINKICEFFGCNYSDIIDYIPKKN